MSLSTSERSNFDSCRLENLKQRPNWRNYFACWFQYKMGTSKGAQTRTFNPVCWKWWAPMWVPTTYVALKILGMDWVSSSRFWSWSLKTWKNTSLSKFKCSMIKIYDVDSEHPITRSSTTTTTTTSVCFVMQMFRSHYKCIV